MHSLSVCADEFAALLLSRISNCRACQHFSTSHYYYTPYYHLPITRQLAQFRLYAVSRGESYTIQKAIGKPAMYTFMMLTSSSWGTHFQKKIGVGFKFVSRFSIFIVLTTNLQWFRQLAWHERDYIIVFKLMTTNLRTRAVVNQFNHYSGKRLLYSYSQMKHLN